MPYLPTVYFQIDRTGAVDIFGPSPAAVAKAKQLMENFSSGDQQTGSATTKTHISDVQPQPPQKENATARNDNNIPNGELYFSDYWFF